MLVLSVLLSVKRRENGEGHKMSDEVVINLSKTKVVFFILGSLGFVILGLWLLVPGSAGAGSNFSKGMIFAVSVACVLFFGLILIYSLKKFFDKDPGLVINEEGIFDNSSAIAAGQINWSEIEDIAITTVNSQNFLTVMVNRPEKYMNTGSRVKDMANKANMKFYGSPINISANALNTGFQDLEDTLMGYMEKYHHPVQSDMRE